MAESYGLESPVGDSLGGVSAAVALSTSLETH